MELFLLKTAAYGPLFIHLSRFVMPVLALWLVARCMRSMLREPYDPEIWAYLIYPDGQEVPLMHWECSLGRSRASDAVFASPIVSRTHAVLTRGEDGEWTIYDLNSKAGTTVDGAPVPPEGALVSDGSCIALGDRAAWFSTAKVSERLSQAETRRSPGRRVRPGASFLLLTLFQLLLALQHACTAQADQVSSILLGFGALCLAQWCYFLIMCLIRRTGFETETLAFFLCTLGMSVCASSTPGDMLKQVILLLAGLFLFILLGAWLRDLHRSELMRIPAAVCVLGLLAANILLGVTLGGAKNWIQLGGFTIQPSEFIKIAYVYTGAATLDRLYRDRNILLFLVFSALCVGALALLGDFGTALVFFAAFLVIAFMRSGNLATVVLAISAAALAGFLMFTIKPHIAQRFSTWGHIWEVANDAGYQQTRALSAAASGGLFGWGAGAGWLSGIVAADTDMVFALLCEEQGLIVALCAVAAVIALGLFAVKSSAQSRSSFYVIAACSAASMMMVQLGLNVLGSTDVLPFTGVTFPFVSKGGSSLICCWALLAYIKAADTRQSASFVVKPLAKYVDGSTVYEEEYDDESRYDGQPAPYDPPPSPDPQGRDAWFDRYFSGEEDDGP